ncbi:MAG: metallophosphoesterase [Myxococcaceae bacterium]|nr:metallophosphoesterase [Myxococcaceae bacterium]MCA3011569.1 metallophosphoesterase [Myxococcaceae bacterium]
MPRHVAIGDPQASFETFLAVLEGHRLLGDDGRLQPDVHLVSMGDHFDYGTPDVRERATFDGEAILAWLTAHPPEQVTVLLGNHDVCRVMELSPYTDEAFAAAHAEARALYDAEADARAFLARHPTVPDAECLARDYSCFSASQRGLVTALLRARRFRLAAHHRGLLLVHAGVTEDDLSLLGIAPTDAASVAEALNAFLDARVEAWRDGALDLSPLHQPGSAASGEGRGVMYHRPCDPSTQPARRLDGPPRRRFDPRRLPAAFPQAIGHIRDAKCRALMPRWSPPGPGVDGPLRSLTIDGEAVRYGPGCEPGARLYFTDGGMLHAPRGEYHLLDLDTRQPLRQVT